MAKTISTTLGGSDRLPASRFMQGGRTVYSLELSPRELMALLPRPAAEQVSEFNRAIRPKHASEFGAYFTEQDEWIAPSLILRTERPFDFEVLFEAENGTNFGMVSIPRSAISPLSILDGQHRTLGFYVAATEIEAEVRRAVSALNRAQSQYPGTKIERDKEIALAAAKRVADRLVTDRLSVQIYVESSPEKFRQMFFDISDNALGITSSVRARFDSRNPVNRALPAVLEHPLLAKRVEMEADRLRQGSKFILSAKNVTEIMRITALGLNKRMGKRVEARLDEDAVKRNAIDFFDTLLEAFPPLQAVQYGQITTEQLRQTSLLGSPAFLRLLAGLYHDLAIEGHRKWPHEKVLEFFWRLAPHVSSAGSPVYEGSIWLENLPSGSFIPGQTTPTTMRQVFVNTYVAMLNWALVPELGAILDAPPVSRPTPVTEDEIALYEEERAAKGE